MHKLIEIFWTFLKLGLSSFGGPAAHLVFFKQRFVEQKHWLTETQYSQIMALTQLLPGPSSSQMGIAIGYLRHGYTGAVMAWLGFTLPSVMIMIGLAILLQKELLHLNQRFFHHISIIVLAIVNLL